MACRSDTRKDKLGKMSASGMPHELARGSFLCYEFVPTHRGENRRRNLVNSSITKLSLACLGVVNVILTETGSLRFGIDCHRLTSESKFSTHWYFWPPHL